MGLPIVCPRCDNVLSQSEQDNHLLCGSCGFYCNIAAVHYIYTDRGHSVQTVPQVQLAEPTLQLQLQAGA